MTRGTRPRRRIMLGAACGAVAVLVTITASACGTVRVTPPATVADPVTVYLTDTGGTSKLVLPRFAGPDDPVPAAYVGYGFGEWAWYAERQEWLLGAPITVFVPTPGALARRAHAPRRAGVPVERWLWAEEVHTIEVDRAAAAALLGRVDAIFDAGSDRLLVDNSRRLEFVPWNRSYWIAQQSTSTTAEWCRELGCETSGWAFRADFEVVGGHGASAHGDGRSAEATSHPTVGAAISASGR